ncbi:MAG: hypothetical protein OEQ53_17770, partial [Saprospiraceae bacterium]|nr:hypothetical protein [Saprospiraceae bacterium]
MSKTNDTSIQLSCWIPSKIGQWMLSGVLVFFGALSGLAQGPNCGPLNASLDADGYAAFEVSEFVINCGTVAEPVTLTITNSFGGLVRFYVNGGGSVTSADVFCTDIISLNACDLLTQELKLNVSNAGGACWSPLTFKQSNGPLVECYPYWLWCLDPQVSDYGLFIDWAYGDQDGEYEPNVDRKYATIPCQGQVPAYFVADWVDPHDCILGDDTAKVIYREFEAFDKEGRRGSCFDTIYVWRLPQLVDFNIYCAERDTVICAEGTAGPYMVLPEIEKYTGIPTGLCDTLYFLDFGTEDGMLTVAPRTFESKCGLQVHVDAWKFEDHCNPQYRVDIEVKQTCYGGFPDDMCFVAAPAGGPGTPNAFEEVSPGSGYWRCTFWITDLDTCGPYGQVNIDKLQDQNICEEETEYDRDCRYDECGEFEYPDYEILVRAGTHDCVAHTYVPPVCVGDDWTGVKQVKARIYDDDSYENDPDLAVPIITVGLQNSGEECYFKRYYEECGYDTLSGYLWESHQQIKLPKGEWLVVYEMLDYCHNRTYTYADLIVKDRTRPVAVADKGVNVSLTDKKVWVDAETFDEGSWDNCGVNMILARRSDWYTACIDLCDDIEWCCASPHADTLYMAFLEREKDGSDHDFYDEVEAHYAKTLEWLCEDGVPCGEIIYNAWLYDLMKYATLECIDHPYPVDGQYFRHIFEQCYYDYYVQEIESKPNGESNGTVFNDLHYDPSNKYDHADHDHYGDYEDYCFDYFKEIDHILNICDEQEEDFHDLISQEVDIYEQIGGGWSDAVPFSCEDACGPVTVELLVMDYWCNWSKAWTDVWVEDKTPVSVEKDV